MFKLRPPAQKESLNPGPAPPDVTGESAHPRGWTGTRTLVSWIQPNVSQLVTRLSEHPRAS